MVDGPKADADGILVHTVNIAAGKREFIWFKVVDILVPTSFGYNVSSVEIPNAGHDCLSEASLVAATKVDGDVTAGTDEGWFTVTRKSVYGHLVNIVKNISEHHLICIV
jgi:hypothetical protein